MEQWVLVTEIITKVLLPYFPDCPIAEPRFVWWWPDTSCSCPTQILCLTIRFGHVMDKAYNKTCITGSKTYVLASSMMDWGEMPNAAKGKNVRTHCCFNILPNYVCGLPSWARALYLSSVPTPCNYVIYLAFFHQHDLCIHVKLPLNFCSVVGGPIMKEKSVLCNRFVILKKKMHYLLSYYYFTITIVPWPFEHMSIE